MVLCRNAHCRSYGKIDGLCLVHAKAAAADTASAAASMATTSSSSSSPLLPPSPSRPAFTPPSHGMLPPTITAIQQPAAMMIRPAKRLDDESSLMMMTQLPPVLPNGRLRCFAPSCGASATGNTPFCPHHQHCVLLVDTQPRQPQPHVLRKRRRVSSNDLAQTTSGSASCYSSRGSSSIESTLAPPSRKRQTSQPPVVQVPAALSPEHEHAQILANLGRST